MGNDPDRLASYACKNDSFHKIPPNLPCLPAGRLCQREG
jgi:hypothetical protein